MAYLRGLSWDHRITLITYEKDEDRADAGRMAQARAECEKLGIDWLPQRFLARPMGLAPALGTLHMVWLVFREVRIRRVRLIHARSYIPAFVALIVGRLTGVPFIFDMRALWPEELITAVRLRRGSPLHRAIVAVERACLKRAAAVVSLTHAAVDHLKKIYPAELAGQRIPVIPTCADLDRFVPAAEPPAQRAIGCLGTVSSGWFRLDWLVAFFAAAARRDPDVVLELTTRDDPGPIRIAFARESDLADRLQIASSPSDKVQQVIQRQIASVMFYAGSEVSELGRAPTRMGEILGCGIPVVANEGVGDVARIIRDYRVGILAKGPGARDMEAAWDELQALLADPDLPVRCRRAAEEVFSLSAGTAAYVRLYAEILAGAKQKQLLDA
jgi:glycosyltransferase involved in cell wall biosynthesis